MKATTTADQRDAYLAERTAAAQGNFECGLHPLEFLGEGGLNSNNFRVRVFRLPSDFVLRDFQAGQGVGLGAPEPDGFLYMIIERVLSSRMAVFRPKVLLV